MNTKNNTKLGFSLVEIAVVVGIVALIVGGVMVGTNLSHTAAVKAVTGEVERFSAMTDLFRKKYDALPGDYYNATGVWGVANADVNACKTTDSTDQRTCNGDGNNWIGTPGDDTTYYESHRFWQHLANEGLLGGKFAGARTATVGSTVTCKGPSYCAPAALSGGLYYAATVNDSKSYFRTGNTLNAVDLFDGNKGNVFVLSKSISNSTTGTTGSYVGAPILTPEEALGIDGKIDDSRPATGKVQTFEPDGGSTYLSTKCADVAVEAEAVYDLTQKTVECALIFTNAF